MSVKTMPMSIGFLLSILKASALSALFFLGIVVFGLTFEVKPNTLINQDVAMGCILLGSIAYVRGWFRANP